ncbi:MAG: hypothetical protein JWL84_1138 [Rhodospirillales bacterium]|jgi:hypothetical protein|nr:hypothetical protein [Rhodospirillales bacterium]
MTSPDSGSASGIAKIRYVGCNVQALQKPGDGNIHASVERRTKQSLTTVMTA